MGLKVSLALWSLDCSHRPSADLHQRIQVSQRSPSFRPLRRQCSGRPTKFMFLFHPNSTNMIPFEQSKWINECPRVPRQQVASATRLKIP